MILDQESTFEEFLAEGGFEVLISLFHKQVCQLFMAVKPSAVDIEGGLPEQGVICLKGINGAITALPGFCPSLPQ
jgi:hypothetical protein